MNQNLEKMKKISFTALFAALIAVGAFLRVPVPMVPFTLQFLFANLAMLVLGKKYGALSVIIYVALGLVGVPIFTKGGGFQYIFEPTFGYLVGFAIGNFAGGAVLERGDRNKLKTLLLSGAVNLLVVYTCGATYFYFITRFYLNSPYTLGALLVMCCLKTLWSDTIFIFFSAFLAKRLNKALKLGFELDKDIREVERIASRIKKGGSADRDDAKFLLTAPLDAVCRAADGIRKAFCGKKFDLCGIVNAKSGNCTEDCKFCAQSTLRHIEMNYPLMSEDKLFEELERLRCEGIVRSSAVLSGRAASAEEVEVIASAAKRFTAGGGSVCVSAGLLDEPLLKKLKEAGVERIHNNLETSRRYFEEICTTHTYDEKIETLEKAKRNGLDICCGGLFGLGETWNDRIELALELRKLDVTSVPVNFYMPPVIKNGAYGLKHADGAEKIEVNLQDVAQDDVEIAAEKVDLVANNAVGVVFNKIESNSIVADNEVFVDELAVAADNKINLASNSAAEAAQQIAVDKMDLVANNAVGVVFNKIESNLIVADNDVFVDELAVAAVNKINLVSNSAAEAAQQIAVDKMDLVANNAVGVVFNKIESNLIVADNDVLTDDSAAVASATMVVNLQAENAQAGAQSLTEAERRRTVALLRFMLPHAAIRLAGGRAALYDFGRSLFCSGANAAIGGDMLTTAGLSVEDDLKRIKKMGFQLTGSEAKEGLGK